MGLSESVTFVIDTFLIHKGKHISIPFRSTDAFRIASFILICLTNLLIPFKLTGQVLSKSDSIKINQFLKEIKKPESENIWAANTGLLRFETQIADLPAHARVRAYSKLGYRLHKMGTEELAAEAFDRGLKLIPVKDNEKRASFLYDKASVLFSGFTKDVIIDFCNDALAVKPKKGSQTEALIYMTRGRAYYENADYKNAMADYMVAKKYFDDHHVRNEDLGFLLHYIGSVFKRQNHDKEALKWYNKIIDLGKEINSPLILAEGYYLASDIYNVAGDSVMELELLLKALKIYQDIKEYEMQGLLLMNIAHHYLQDKNNRAAKEYLDSCIALNKRYPTYEHISTIWRYYAKYYSQIGDYSKAIEYIDRALAEAEKSKSQKTLLMGDVYRTKAWIYYDFGHYKEAFDNLDEYQYYWEDMINEQNSKIVHEMEARYQNEKKKKEIELLNKDKAINQAELEKSRQRNIFLIIGLVMAGVFVVFILNRYQFIRHQKNIIQKEKQRSEELLLNILPEEVAEELKNTGSAEAKLIDEVTVLFTDFKGFTAHSADLSPQELVAEINECFVAFDYIMEEFGIEKIKTIGDSYMAAGGLPTPNKTHVEDVVNAALRIQEYMVDTFKKRQAAGKSFFEARIGVHTGPVVAGIVGIKKFAYDIWGDTVNTASRMESNGAPGKVNVSSSTYELLKNNSEFVFESRGKIQAKGKGELEMYFVSRKQGSV